ncbi:hypothetical protein, partial [Enterobacter cloacae]|uniref:hypothetical protein n=1 Tax=Enterobacter cloacae TaxID=550 RepID=UPI001D7EA46B
ITNYTEVTGYEKSDGAMLSGAQVRDVLTGREFTISARHIVNAGGVFAERIAALSGDESDVAVAPSKGVHLVVSAEKVGIGEAAVVLPETDDG